MRNGNLDKAGAGSRMRAGLVGPHEDLPGHEGAEDGERDEAADDLHARGTLAAAGDAG